MRNAIKLLALSSAGVLISLPVSAQQSSTHSYDYDAQGRLTRATFDTEMEVAYTYDKANNRLSVAATDPAAPTFSVDDVSVIEGGVLSFTITKAGTTSNSYSLDYGTEDGTADSSDYTATSGTLTFTSSETSKIVTVQTTAETLQEPDETIALVLTNPTAGSGIDDGSGLGTILDDDTPANDPPVAVNDTAVVDEFDSDTFVLTANDSDPDGDPLTITAVTQPWNGFVSIINATTVNIFGTDDGGGTFTYTISDGNGGTDTATVTLTVNPSDPPF